MVSVVVYICMCLPVQTGIFILNEKICKTKKS